MSSLELEHLHRENDWLRQRIAEMEKRIIAARTSQNDELRRKIEALENTILHLEVYGGES